MPSTPAPPPECRRFAPVPAGTSSDGGCLGYVSLARGLVGLCLNGPNLDPFDIAALVPVVEAAGGRITDWQGNALTIESEGEIVATSGPGLHESALEVLSNAPQ